jgi:O-antigen/teichoic acid export membrane protein
LVLAIAIAGGVVIGAPFGVPLVFGDGYAAAVVPLVIMAAALPARYLGHAYGVSLTAAGTQRERAKLFAVAMTISIACEILLVSAFGLLGAAVAVLLASACLVSLWFRAARASLGSELSARPLVVALAIEAVALVLALGAMLAG